MPASIPNATLPDSVRLERRIGAPPAAVWAVLADYPNISSWNSGITNSYATSDATEGVGAQRHCDLAPMGGLDETIQEWAPEERLVISIDKAPKIPIKQGLMTFSLAPDGDGTAFTMNYEYKAKGGPFSGLMGRMLRGQLEKGFTDFIDELEPAAAAS